jgi:hypothetical protein
MTYNQIIKLITDTIESHPMVHEVLSSPPAAWLNSNNVPSFPSASFTIDSGSYNLGREQVFRIDLWLLDKSGTDAEYEQEVVSDMHGIGYDVIQELRSNMELVISDTVGWEALSEKFEDYLSGVKISFDLSVIRNYGNCDSPINS